ncbi:MAG TPA: hypothetical protein VGM29_15825 [Polyangiaceae bacterium]|jgi:hypothetical protein
MSQIIHRIVILSLLLAPLLAITACKSSSPMPQPKSPTPVGMPKY